MSSAEMEGQTFATQFHDGHLVVESSNTKACKQGTRKQLYLDSVDANVTEA